MNIVRTTLISLVIMFVTVFVVYNYVPLKYLAYIEMKTDKLGSTITTIAGSDTLSASRTVINTNFSNLNTDKLESGNTAASLTITTLTNSTFTSGSQTLGTPTATSSLTVSYTSADSILTTNSSGVIIASSTPAAANFLARTSIGIASSTLWGIFSIEQGVGSSPLLVIGDQGTSTPHFIVTTFGNVGIGTSSPATTSNLAIQSTGTSTLNLHSSSATKGGCIQLEGPDGNMFSLYATSAGPAVINAGVCK